MLRKIIAEIGINHNGDLELAKQLIVMAAEAGCDYVKFQKRTPDICVPEHQKSLMRETPWGELTYLEYKHKLEFSYEEYVLIDEHCRQQNIDWFASVWDIPSVDFMKQFTSMAKIPSALITDDELVAYARKSFTTLLVSTGMSTEDEIVKVMQHHPDVVMHTNSNYPSNVEELNLNYIHHLIANYPQTAVGYSGHEYGLVPTFAATAMGAEWIERHITLNRFMWGSDQMASVEPIGLVKLVKGIRDIEKAEGNLGPRQLLESELVKRKSLRGV
jgi:N-acetylneuraminate synthase